MLCCVALVRTDVSEELSVSFIRVTRIGELGTKLQLALFLVHPFLSPWWRRRWVPPKRRFLQEPNDITSKKTPFFIVTTVKTSNITTTGLLLLFQENSLETSWTKSREEPWFYNSSGWDRKWRYSPCGWIPVPRSKTDFCSHRGRDVLCCAVLCGAVLPRARPYQQATDVPSPELSWTVGIQQTLLWQALAWSQLVVNSEFQEKTFLTSIIWKYLPIYKHTV
jgi:hypothetical protein